MDLKELVIALVAIIIVRRLSKMLEARSDSANTGMRYLKAHIRSDDFIRYLTSRYKMQSKALQINELSVAEPRSLKEREKAQKKFQKIDDNWNDLLGRMWRQAEADRKILHWLTFEQQSVIMNNHRAWADIQHEIDQTLAKHTTMRQCLLEVSSPR